MLDNKWTSLSKNGLRPLIAAFVVFAPVALAQLPPKNPTRSWVLPDSGETTASIVALDGYNVTLRLANGQTATVKIADLADADRAYIDEWIESQPIELPASVGVDGNKVDVEIISEDDAEGTFVYRTDHFEFTSEGKLTQNLLRDVARNFEATYELMKALPWAIGPRPESGDRFKALLVRSRSRYEELGAPKNSGGVYFRSRKVFIVPFESLGIRELGKSYTKAADYRSDTLIHELTHQMMHAWLPLLPQWVVEGTAEFTNALPLRLGTFRLSSAKSGLKDYIAAHKRGGGSTDPYPLEELFWITNEKWNAVMASDPNASGQLYYTSYLLVYYFMFLEPPGDGSPFVRYLRSIRKEKERIETYFAEVDEFKKLPDVESLPGDRYRWPSHLTHPTAPEILTSEEKRNAFEKESLEILLNGRTSEQLMEDIRSAYRKLGIKL